MEPVYQEGMKLTGQLDAATRVPAVAEMQKVDPS